MLRTTMKVTDIPEEKAKPKFRFEKGRLYKITDKFKSEYGFQILYCKENSDHLKGFIIYCENDLGRMGFNNDEMSFNPDAFVRFYGEITISQADE